MDSETRARTRAFLQTQQEAMLQMSAFVAQIAEHLATVAELAGQLRAANEEILHVAAEAQQTILVLDGQALIEQPLTEN